MPVITGTPLKQNITLCLVGLVLATASPAYGKGPGGMSQAETSSAITVHYSPISFTAPKNNLTAIYRTDDMLVMAYAGGASISLLQFDHAFNKLKNTQVTTYQWFDCIFRTSSTACVDFPDRLLTQARMARKIREHGVKRVRKNKQHDLHVFEIQYENGRFRAIVTAPAVDGGYYEFNFKQAKRSTVTNVIESIDMDVQ